MQSRTNIIMSHGGRHGAGGTFLRGAKIDPKTSESVPNRLLTGDSREAWAGDPVQAAAPRKATNEDAAAFAKGSPEAKALLEAVEKDRAAKAAEAGEPPPDPVEVTTTPPPPPTTPPPPPPGFPKTEKPSPPTSRRQLTVMRKSELVTLADAYEVDSDGTADDIRDRLKVHFFDHEAGDTEE